MLRNAQRKTFQKKLTKFLNTHFDTDIESATDVQLYYAISEIVNRFLYDNKSEVYENSKKEIKTVHYVSIEFLLGKSLKNNLWNLGLENTVSRLLKRNNKNLEKVFDVEQDAGLGNGGLGRLAACYLESLAKCNYSAVGHTIKYEFGLFKQKIIDGKQYELPDEWQTGNVWMFERNDLKEEIEIGGYVIEHYSEEKGLNFELAKTIKIEAVPYDILISAYGTNNTSTLRLWEARAKDKIDLHLFDLAEYESALKSQVRVSEINKVLYPNDESERGKNLRLIQEYFLTSATIQSILRQYFLKNSTLENLKNEISIHINDTHPALCIPEMMRLLIDKYGFGWEKSWEAICESISYTNHTILSESLEVKKLAAIQKFMPRIAQILQEIDRRNREKLSCFFKNDYQKIENLAIISGNNVYMANLAICASKFVNGVAKIHSDILKNKLFYDYSKVFPEKFKNITNGISHRRWLSESNAKLDKFIISLIGNNYYDDASKLENLTRFENDDEVLEKLEQIKFENKKRLVRYLKETKNIEIDVNSRFDIQVKRIHEYKRQLLNILKIIYLVNEIRQNPTENYAKQTFIFSGKAASGYQTARRIIELIVCLSKEIDNDDIVSKYLKVVFLENYNVSLAEILMPATEVSEQISLAGREASGTGNMKAVINGALMLCTVDGANIEICEQCNKDNMFEFGLNSDEVYKINSVGYNPLKYYEDSEKIRAVIESLKAGIGGEKFEDIARYLLGFSNRRDNYMCLADFESYLAAHYYMDRIYKNKREWNRRCLHSIAKMGYFSSDRSIEEYANNIWKLQKKN